MGNLNKNRRQLSEIFDDDDERRRFLNGFASQSAEPIGENSDGSPRYARGESKLPGRILPFDYEEFHMDAGPVLLRVTSKRGTELIQKVKADTKFGFFNHKDHVDFEGDFYIVLELKEDLRGPTDAPRTEFDLFTENVREDAIDNLRENLPFWVIAIIVLLIIIIISPLIKTFNLFLKKV